MTEVLGKRIDLETFILIDEIDDNEILNSLLVDIHNNKTYFHQPTNVKGKHTEFNFLNHNINFHNFLKSIKNKIQLVWKKNFILHNSWANIYNKEDYANSHHHKCSTAFSGILYLTDGPGPGTYFSDYDLTVHEKKGRYVLFHGNLLHEVKKFNYSKDRITIAFNCVEPGFLSKDEEVFFIK